MSNGWLALLPLAMVGALVVLSAGLSPLLTARCEGKRDRQPPIDAREDAECPDAEREREVVAARLRVYVGPARQEEEPARLADPEHVLGVQPPRVVGPLYVNPKHWRSDDVRWN